MNRKHFSLACFFVVLTGMLCAHEFAHAQDGSRPVKGRVDGFEVDDTCSCGLFRGLWGRMVNYGSGPSFRVYGYPPTGCNQDYYCHCPKKSQSGAYSVAPRRGLFGWRQCNECLAH